MSSETDEEDILVHLLLHVAHEADALATATAFELALPHEDEA